MIEILDYVFGIRFCPIKAAQDNMLDKRTRASARFGGEYPLRRHRLMGLFQHYWIHIKNLSIIIIKDYMLLLIDNGERKFKNNINFKNTNNL